MAVLMSSALVSVSHAQVRPTTAGAESMALMEEAEDLKDDAQYAEAAAVYERAIALAPDNELAYLELSDVLYVLAEHDRALSHLGRYLDGIRWSSAIATERGRHLVALGRLDEAEEQLSRVTETDSAAFLARLELGELHLRRGKFSEADDELGAYLANRPEELSGEDGVVRARQAFAALRAERLGRAEDLARRNIAADDRDETSKLVLFSALVANGRCAEALAMFDENHGTLMADKAPSVHFNRASCLRKDPARHPEALSALAMYSARRPADPRAVALKGQILVDDGQPESALREYRAAMEGGIDLRAKLGLLLFELGRRDEGADALWPLVEEGTEDPAVLSAVAETFLRRGTFERAHAAAAHLIAVRHTGEALTLHGHTLLALDRLGEAEAAYRKALATSKELEPARRGLAETLEAEARSSAASGDLDRAHELLSEAAALDPKTPSITTNLALVELSMGKAADAAKRLEANPAAIKGNGARILVRALAASGQKARAMDTPLSNGGSDALAKVERALLLRDEAPRSALSLLKEVSSSPGVDVSRIQAETIIIEAELALTAGDPRPARALLTPLVDRTSGTLKTRVMVDLALAAAGAEGLRAAKDALAGISDIELGAVVTGRDELSPRQRVMLLAALISGETSSAVLTAARVAKNSDWFEQALFDAIRRGDQAGAARIVARAPRTLQSPEFRHNAAVRRWPKGQTDQQIREVEALASAVPLAHVNLALARFRKGDFSGTAAALERARNVPSTRDLATQWLKWHEQLYGE